MKWTKKTMTWGGYAKFCGISTLISVVITGVYFVHAYWDNIRYFFGQKIRRIIHKED